MKKYLKILLTATCLFNYSTSHALHSNFNAITNTIQICSSFCEAIDSLEVGSTISLFGEVFNAQDQTPYLTTLDSSRYSIEIEGLSSSLRLTPNNTSLISSNILASTDIDIEETTILGGNAKFDTTLAFPLFSLLFPGSSSELLFDFDANNINLYLTNIEPNDMKILVASTTAVPVPSALILFLSGAMLLVSFSGKKSA